MYDIKREFLKDVENVDEQLHIDSHYLAMSLGRALSGKADEADVLKFYKGYAALLYYTNNCSIGFEVLIIQKFLLLLNTHTFKKRTPLGVLFFFDFKKQSRNVYSVLLFFLLFNFPNYLRSSLRAV